MRVSVFGCIGRKLLWHLRKLCKIFQMCSVLHYLALGHGIHLSPGLPPPQNDDPDPQRPPRQEGFQHKARLSENVMQHLGQHMSQHPYSSRRTMHLGRTGARDSWTLGAHCLIARLSSL
ncbi:hypothetical protein CRENBAI_023485 [Crenichthys baileyi]|uniref:Uncharacterized protein n=1 Tax=Crenichthys baileyi TaxID=28760 RepID=A0AAV9SGB6_9TELE